MDIIDELKKNKRPLILMNSELQNAMLSMSPKKFICLQHTSTLNDPQWEVAVNGQWYVNDNLYNIYRLSPDYENEPEIVECEIIVGGCSDLVYIEDCVPNDIEMAYHDPDFIGFKFEDGTVMGSPVKYSVHGITSHGYWASYEDLKAK